MSQDLTGPLKDPTRIVDRADLPESVGSYASVILDRLREDDYHIPADARTYAAAVYVAARDEGQPITPGEIADASGVEERALSREYRRLVEFLDISPSLVSPSDYLSRFVEELDVSPSVAETATDLLAEGEEAGLWANRTPAVSAALSLYAASDLDDGDLTQVRFEEVGVSRTSVRKGYRDVLDLRDASEEDQKLDDGDLTPLFDALDEIHAQSGFRDRVREDAADLLRDLENEEWILGKSPSPIAAGAYWISATANSLRLSQAEAADLAESHKVTVNRRVGSIRESVEFDPADWSNPDEAMRVLS
jgi:transcription initiation factor TFIIIB Brf1 subunit/transcription initiation factor TFIIB